MDVPLSRKYAKEAESVGVQRFPPLIISSHAGGHWFESSSLHQKVPDFVRNQELFLFMSSNSDAAFWRFSLDPNADPKAERSRQDLDLLTKAKILLEPTVVPAEQ